MTNKTIEGWHFAADTLRDGSPLPRKGEALPPIADPEPCVRGYHASPDPLSALLYAPGPRVARVRLSGVVIPHGDPPDKWAASDRIMITDYVDVSVALRAFACRCALDVAHMRGMPAVVREYLKSDGAREDIRDAAWYAARNAARYAAMDAAREAAWYAARYAAMDAAWDAAREAAREAAMEATRKAAMAASRYTAWDAAWDASWDAANSAQRARLAAMLEGLLPCTSAQALEGER